MENSSVHSNEFTRTRHKCPALSFQTAVLLGVYQVRCAVRRRRLGTWDVTGGGWSLPVTASIL